MEDTIAIIFVLILMCIPIAYIKGKSSEEYKIRQFLLSKNLYKDYKEWEKMYKDE